MEKVVLGFKALSDINRIRILKMLEVRALCVCEITDVLGLATSTVSKHLSILRDTGFILDSKEGKWVNYQLNNTMADPYVQQLLPLIRSWLPDYETILDDKKTVAGLNRHTICGINPVK